MKAFKNVVYILVATGLVHSSGRACEIKSQKDLMSRIKSYHPELRLREDRSQILKAGIRQASQRPNPQLNFNTNHGSEQGSRSFESNANLQFVFELGGKRSSRIDIAENSKRLGDVRIDNEADRVLIDASLKVARYSQVKVLLDLYKESLEVFKKMRTSLRRNKSLSPEQRVQEDILDMEVSKHRIRISNLTSELSHLEKILKLYSGGKCQLKLAHEEFQLEDPKSLKLDGAKTPEFKELELKTSLLASKVNFERSLSYPDLKIGPSFQMEEEMGHKVDRFGVALTMDLPVLSWNRGGREKALREHEVIKDRVSFMEKENELVLRSLFETYKTTFETLKFIPKTSELLEKHHRIERLFVRGLISISTMLDGHDELLDLIELRDQHELLALESLLKLKQANDNLDLSLSMEGRNE